MITLETEHAARLAEVRQARAEGRQIERPPAKPRKPRQPKTVCMERDFRYVVTVGRHRIAGPYFHRWQASRNAADVDGAEVKRVAVRLSSEELTV